MPEPPHTEQAHNAGGPPPSAKLTPEQKARLIREALRQVELTRQYDEEILSRLA